MYLKIGNTTICDSDTDGITKMISFPIPKLSKESDSVQPTGSTNPTHFARNGVSRTIDISVLRQFTDYRSAEIWVVEHMAEMERLRECGDLDFSSVLDIGYLYGGAALSDIEVVDFKGISLEMKYTFKAGRAIDYIAISSAEDEEEFMLEVNGFVPLWRVAKN